MNPTTPTVINPISLSGARAILAEQTLAFMTGLMGARPLEQWTPRDLRVAGRVAVAATHEFGRALEEAFGEPTPMRRAGFDEIEAEAEAFEDFHGEPHECAQLAWSGGPARKGQSDDDGHDDGGDDGDDFAAYIDPGDLDDDPDADGEGDAPGDFWVLLHRASGEWIGMVDGAPERVDAVAAAEMFTWPDAQALISQAGGAGRGPDLVPIRVSDLLASGEGLLNQGREDQVDGDPEDRAAALAALDATPFADVID